MAPRTVRRRDKPNRNTSSYFPAAAAAAAGVKQTCQQICSPFSGVYARATTLRSGLFTRYRRWSWIPWNLAPRPCSSLCCLHPPDCQATASRPPF